MTTGEISIRFNILNHQFKEIMKLSDNEENRRKKLIFLDKVETLLSIYFNIIPDEHMLWNIAMDYDGEQRKSMQR